MSRLVPMSLLPALIAGAGLCQEAAPAGGGGRAATRSNLDLPFDAKSLESIVFYGQRFEGVFFCFVCDRSSTMAGAPWRRLQQELTGVIRGLSEPVQFAIIFFDAGMASYPASGKPAQASPDMKAAAVAMVLSTITGIGTCYKEPLLKALLYAQSSSAVHKQIIVLGDGLVNCGSGPEETLEAVTTANVTRVPISTLYIGEETEGKPFLRELAARNGGTYREVH